MTLTATFSAQDIPFALGDLLVSGTERVDATPSIPSVGSVTNVFPAGSGFSIIGLRQKVHILSNDCVIAWSGSEIHARVAIRELRQLALQGELNHAAIQKYVADNRNDIEPHIQLMGWVRDGIELIQFSHPPIAESTVLPFEKILMSGSGTERFHRLIQNLPATPTRCAGATNVMDTAISSAIYAISSSIEYELITQGNLVEFFGGWWEIAFYDRLRFIKLSDITFAYWEILDGPIDLQLQFPRYVVKHDYLGHVLRLRVARQNGNRLAHECYFVPPLDLSTSEDEKDQLQNHPLPSMNSPRFCHCIYQKTKETVYSVTRIENAQRSIDAGAQFFEDSRGLYVRVNPTFREAMLSSIKAAKNGREAV